MIVDSKVSLNTLLELYPTLFFITSVNDSVIAFLEVTHA